MALGALDPFNVRRQLGRLDRVRGAASLASDLSFLRHAREALLPLPVVDRRHPVETDVFPPFRRRPAAALEGKRVAVIGSGGSGACISLVGVARAFEEAGVRPAAISACSGSALWGAMWAAGMSAQEMAEFSLSWRPQDYLDIQWARLPRFALSAMRGFTGLAKGDALERLFDRRLWHMSAGETDIPFHTIAFNLDQGRVEHFGSATTPELTLGELARIAVALPLVMEAVRVEGDLYVDGGVVDLFPVEPILGGRFDRIFGLNVILPPGLEGEDISGWERRRGGIADVGRQLRIANHVEIARRGAKRLGRKLTLIEPVPHEEQRGVGFFDLFFDRRRWPELMRQGYEVTGEALAPFRRRRQPARGAAGRGKAAPKT
jgi:NTE family protein